MPADPVCPDDSGSNTDNTDHTANNDQAALDLAEEAEDFRDDSE